MKYKWVVNAFAWEYLLKMQEPYPQPEIFDISVDYNSGSDIYSIKESNGEVTKWTGVHAHQVHSELETLRAEAEEKRQSRGMGIAWRF